MAKEIYQAIAGVVGAEYVSDDLAVRQAYSKDGSLSALRKKHHKDPVTIPDLVVLPGSTAEVQGVLRIADRYGLSVIPIGSGVNMVGLCIPNRPGTISLDLKRMNRILDIDERTMTATIQPATSFARLQAETMKRGLWNGGAPLAPAVVGVISNIVNSGIWQSALAYGSGTRSIVSLKIVLANGDVLRTGSAALPGSGSFWWRGPGPDLTSIFEFTHYGALGVITEATVKLYPWAGREWPQEEIYDRPPLPDKHRIFYIEYLDFDSMNEMLYQTAHAGIGTHLNGATDAYNAFYTQRTQELTEKRFREGFFPKYFVYVIIAGISSERQLEYEEKVLRAIVAETGGKFRDDLAEELSTWHGDAFRSGDGVRMCRHGSFSGIRMGSAHIENNEQYHQVHYDVINRRPHYMLDEEMPYAYVYDRGYWCFFETDTYYDQSSIEEIGASRESTKDGFLDGALKDGLGGGFYYFEPMTSILAPQVGPNFPRWLKKIKRIFDPNDTMNPGRLVEMEEKT